MLKDGFMEFLYGNIFAADSACRPLYILFNRKFAFSVFEENIECPFRESDFGIQPHLFIRLDDVHA